MTSSSAKPPPFPTSASTVQQTVNTISGRQYYSTMGNKQQAQYLMDCTFKLFWISDYNKHTILKAALFYKHRATGTISYKRFYSAITHFKIHNICYAISSTTPVCFMNLDT